MGGKNYAGEFIVCKYLKHPCIIGTDLLKKNAIYAGWGKQGKFNLKHDDDFLVESIDMQMTGQMLCNKHNVELSNRHFAMIETKAKLTKEEMGHTYDIKPNFLSMDQNPQIEIISMIHLLEIKDHIPFAIINMAHEAIKIPKNEILGYLYNIDDDVKDILMQAIEEDPTLEESPIMGPLNQDITLEELNEETLIEKRFITSPADVTTN